MRLAPPVFFCDLKRPKEMLLTVPELAEYLRIHSSTVYRLLRSRTIPGFKIGGRLAIQHRGNRPLAYSAERNRDSQGETSDATKTEAARADPLRSNFEVIPVQGIGGLLGCRFPRASSTIL